MKCTQDCQQGRHCQCNDDIEGLYGNEWVEFGVAVLISVISVAALGFFMGYFS